MSDRYSGDSKVDAAFHGGDDEVRVECCGESMVRCDEDHTDGQGSRWHCRVSALHNRVIATDALRLERDALQDALIRVLDALPTCRFCGQPFRAVACGPHHAVVAEDPASHWIFKEAKG